MTDHPEPLPLLQGLNVNDYEIGSLEDEIRVDRLCVTLLKHLNQHLTREQELPPEQAGELCHGADYFLREFVIATCNDNLFTIDAVRVRQFAGHWYIIRTMEPNMVDLGNILSGATACYRFLAKQGLIDGELAEEIATACADRDYYAKRIEDFWAIVDGGYDDWRAACPFDTPGDTA